MKNLIKLQHLKERMIEDKLDNIS